MVMGYTGSWESNSNITEVKEEVNEDEIMG